MLAWVTGAIVLHEAARDLARNVIEEEVTLVRLEGTRSHYTTAVRVRSVDKTAGLMQKGRSGTH